MGSSRVPGTPRMKGRTGVFKGEKKLEGVLQGAPSDLVCFSARSDGNRNGRESQSLTTPMKLPPPAHRS